MPSTVRRRKRTRSIKQAANEAAASKAAPAGKGANGNGTASDGAASGGTASDVAAFNVTKDDAKPASDDIIQIEADGLRYTLDGPLPRGGKVIVRVRSAAAPDGHDAAALVDRIDLLAHRSRLAFARLVAETFGREPSQIMGHLALLLDTAERGRAQQPKPEQLTPARRDAALALLDAPDLLDRAADTMTNLGYVGEPIVKRIAYLVATSRLLPKPLSTILMAPSGCGKSELLDAVTKLMPEECIEFLSRLTPAALYYAGPQALRHKVIIVDEQQGADDADYAVRTLQSKGLLRLAAPANGKPAAPITVHGPISLMSGTTSQTLNPENLSRVLELVLDDSPEQTKRIQEAQCAAWSGAQSNAALQVWQDAQRLLEPLPIIIPYAPRLRFPARTTADRRASAKLLGLIAAHALLHQRQRERDRHGRLIATVTDYAVVFELLRASVQDAVDGLSPRATRLYRALIDAKTKTITRREAATCLAWGYNTAKRAIEELLAQELLAVAERGPPARYRVLDRSLLGGQAELVSPDALG